MNCYRCNKTGADPYKYRVGDGIETVYLCAACRDVYTGTKPDAPSGVPRALSNSASGGLLGLERRCPSCGMKLSSIRKSGYIGCAGCFSYFRNELIPVMDRFQSNVISSPEKKRREMTIIMLEDEYSRLSARETAGIPERNAVSQRLCEIEEKLASLGVLVDG